MRIRSVTVLAVTVTAAAAACSSSPTTSSATAPSLVATTDAYLYGRRGSAEYDGGFTSTSSTGDRWGQALATSSAGDRVVVGAPGPNDSCPFGGNIPGYARIYARTGATWNLETELAPASTVPCGAGYGGSVAMDATGARVVIAAPGEQTAYVFVRNGTTWTQEAMLEHPGSGTFGNSLFATAVTITPDGSRVIVGDPYAQVGSTNYAGTAYVFVHGTTWTEEAQLLSTDPASDGLGGVVAIASDGATAYVAETFGNFVRVYTRSGSAWTEQQKIVAPMPQPADRFGTAIATDADAGVLIVGARGRNAGSTGSGIYPGAALVFTRALGGAYSLETELTATSSGNQEFGDAVAIDATGEHIAIGFGQGQSAGWLAAVYTHDTTGWGTGTFVRSALPAASGHMHMPVALSSDASLLFMGDAGTDMGPDLCGQGYYCRIPSNVIVTGLTLAPPGHACSNAAECTTGSCVDGVCCSSACGGGVLDCEACSVAAGGTQDGTCTPLNPQAAAMITCREATDVCDVPETCSPTSTTCPADAVVPQGTTCRPSLGDCDVAEVCDGASVACPPDHLAPPGTVCRPAVAPCDIPEACLSGQLSCPPDVTTCGQPDAGVPHDASVDAKAAPDAGAEPPPPPGGCAATRGSDAWWLLAAVLFVRRRRRRI